MKKSLLTLSLSVMALAARAQDGAPVTDFRDDPFNHPLFPIYVVAGMIALAILLVIIVAVYLLRVLNILIEDAARQRAAAAGTVYVPPPSFWERFSHRLNRAVPVEQEQTIELDHNYDGIKELDNHLPPWWKWLFYGTVAWSAVYLVVYHLSGSLPLSAEEYAMEVSTAEENARKFRESQPREAIDENTLAFTNDPVSIERGRSVFMDNNCGSCHRNDGGGNTIGPNLTDEYWLHGGDARNIFATIRNGVIERGMPAWGKAMSAEDVRDVTFFVMSLQGSKPENPKAPQGEIFQMSKTGADTLKTSATL